MKPTNVLLVRVGELDRSHSHTTPPLGIMYLAAYLRERFDVNVRLIDQFVQGFSFDDVAQAAEDMQADVVGLSCLTSSGWMLGEIATRVRKRLPECLVMIGGPHATAFKEQVLEKAEDADLLVVGEGELALEQIFNAFLHGGDYSTIPGLIWREPGKEVSTNPGSTPYVEDVDSLPFPAYDLIDVTRFWKYKSFVLVPGRKYITLMSSRGCPYQCNYCHQVFGKRFRPHSVERILSEVEHVIKTYGINDIEFVDDIFNHDYDRALEFCEEMQRRNIRVKLAFPNGFRTDALGEDLIDALVDAGMYYASFALESGSPRIQKRMGKNLMIDSFVENLAYAVSKGVFANGYAMLGFPTETEAEMKQTVSIMTDSKLHTGQFFTVTPYPGTPLYREVAETMPERVEGIEYDHGMYGQMYVNLSAEPDEVLFGLQRSANRRFYFKPSRVFRILRDHPAPQALPQYGKVYIERVTKGLFGKH